MRFLSGYAALSAPDVPAYGRQHERFWEMHEKARGLVDAVERIQKYNQSSKDRQRVNAQLGKHQRAWSAAKSVDNLWRQISPYRKQIDRIAKDKNLTAEVKR